MKRGDRRGSSASDKSLAFAVRDEKKIVFRAAQQTVASGWLIGLDDYHFVVVDENLEVILVHKSATVARITNQQLSDDDRSKQIRNMTSKFRATMLTTYLGHTETEPAKEPAA